MSTHTDVIYLAAVEAMGHGGPAALRDVVTCAPLVAGIPVIEFDSLSARDTPERPWDETVRKVAGAIRVKLSLLNAANLEVTWLPDDLIYGQTVLPAPGTATVVATYDANSAMVALVALGNDDGKLELITRIHLDVDRYSPVTADVIADFRDVLTGLDGLDAVLEDTIAHPDEPGN